MTNIKTLAEELRGKIGSPANTLMRDAGGTTDSSCITDDQLPSKPDTSILEMIRTYDSSDHKSTVHVRFDAKTLLTMNQLKIATGIDITKLVAYSVNQFFSLHPELKIIIKQYIQQLE